MISNTIIVLFLISLFIFLLCYGNRVPKKHTIIMIIINILFWLSVIFIR